MAMDADLTTYFKTAYGMSRGDDFIVLLSRPISVKTITVVTGDNDGNDILTNAAIDTSPDTITYSTAASFNAQGVATASLKGKPVMAFRIHLTSGRQEASLVIREITVDSAEKITHVEIGSGRGFVDISRAPEVAAWAAKAESQMESFWPDTAALLYTPGFITPNAVNVIYRGPGPGVTDIAATGGGDMVINTTWCHTHPEDTGLTVHETAHVIQAFVAYDPVWLVEGEADYIRWIKFEPQNYQTRLNPNTATYHDAYRTTASFLGWLELHYDNCLVTQLNRAVRVHAYNNDLFKQYCGKDVDTLWAEFIAAYKANRDTLLTPDVPAADQARALPAVTAGSSVPVDLSSAYDTIGITKDGAAFSADGGIDGGGTAYSGDALGTSQTYKGVQFTIAAAGQKDVITGSGQTIALPAGSYASLWLLGTSVQGDGMAQDIAVTYTDGTSDKLAQNFSDWYEPRGFPGEYRAVTTPYRNAFAGEKDPRPFNVYAYAFSINHTKTVKSIALPDNPTIKILAISLAN
jgi:hypothetical protein